MENRLMKTPMGILNLAGMEFASDTMEVFIPVMEVSDKLEGIILENVRKTKENFQSQYMDGNGLRWSDAGIRPEYQALHITITGNGSAYELCFGFSDKANEWLDTGFCIGVDLSGCAAEVKRIIADAVMEKFFR